MSRRPLPPLPPGAKPRKPRPFLRERVPHGWVVRSPWGPDGPGTDHLGIPLDKLCNAIDPLHKAGVEYFDTEIGDLVKRAELLRPHPFGPAMMVAPNDRAAGRAWRTELVAEIGGAFLTSDGDVNDP